MGKARLAAISAVLRIRFTVTLREAITIGATPEEGARSCLGAIGRSLVSVSAIERETAAASGD
jgi:hypothetical protein